MPFLFQKRFLSFASLLLSAAFLFSSLQGALDSRTLPTVVEAQEKTVILDAGHGGVDSGTVGVNGVLEKDLNLAVVFLLADYFREAGVKVLLTREEDTLVLSEEERRAPRKKEKDLTNRLAIAAAHPEAVFVSIHMNSFPDSRYHGFEVYHAADGESTALAQRIASTVKQELEPDNKRGAKQAGNNIYLLANAVTPSVLIECGFLSNPSDAAKLSDKDYQKRLSFCIFCAIMEAEDSKT